MDILDILIIILLLCFSIIGVIGLIAEKKNGNPEPDQNEPRVSFTEMKARKEARDREARAKARREPTVSFPCVKSMEVKGTIYRSLEEKAAARYVERGDILILEVDPENPVDPNAVKVLTQEGVHIGFVQYDIAQFVKKHINKVKSCTVTKVSKHDVPYIDALISFGSGTYSQPKIIPKELQVSPEDKMRDLMARRDVDYSYRYVYCHVIGTFELPSEALHEARKLIKGDKVVLKKSPEESDFFPYRLDVYTENDCMIGFIYGEFAREPYLLFNDVYTVMVDTSLDDSVDGNVFIKIYLPEGVKATSESSDTNLFYSSNGNSPYPQLRYVDSIKHSDPEAALNIALPIADKESGIRAKFLCCQIYRLQKNYEAEYDMIRRILDRIDTINSKEITPSELRYMRYQAPVFLKRLNTVESRLNSKNNKNSSK